MNPPIRVSFALLACGLFALVSTFANSQRPRVRWNAPPDEWHWNIPEKIRGFTHGLVHSKSMNRTVGYNISLPPSYMKESKRRYPVVYYLHGASGSELSAYELGDVVRRLNRAGKIGDVIYVFPNGGHFSKYRDWDKGNVKAETFIIRELIPYIDKTYRTIATREGRALCGFSMGGDGALRFAFKYPDLFCAAASMSAAIDWGAPRGGSDTIFAHSRKHVAKIRGKTGLMMVVGANDRLARSHKRLTAHLDELKIPYRFQSLPGIGHNLGAIKKKSGDEIVLMLAKHYAKAK
jgi:enterochelin esterase-like enzyme